MPKDQRPVNELAQLKNDVLYRWVRKPDAARCSVATGCTSRDHVPPPVRVFVQGSLDMTGYVQRLAGVFFFFLALVGGPIAYQTFSPAEQPIEWVLSASVGSLVVVAIVVVRIFLGWAYVSDRLLSASYAYEETGWWVRNAG